MSLNLTNHYIVHPLLRARDWQHRPQLDRVCKWWRDGGRGLCALIGMGGAGKTAIAERFLRILPNGLPEDPDVTRDASLPAPRGLFVFSFYDAPNPEYFFQELQTWLEQTPRFETLLSVNQMLYLLQRNPGLIVLDGLEKVQEDGARGLFGRLSSPKLRQFLDHVAAGNADGLSLLVTSRFPLADLRDARPAFFHKFSVEEIAEKAGVQLLRARGVRGADGKLKTIVGECGRHALTVDLAGGYIVEFGGGDPNTPLDLGSPEELQAAVEREPDEAKRGVLKQGLRFARVAQRYRQGLLQKDEAALALLERICLFRLGADLSTLAAIFTGSKAAKISGKSLAGLNPNQLQDKLDWLVRMRIVEANATPRMEGEAKARYTVHPAVRDGFLKYISREIEQAGHEALRQGLEVSLGDAPGDNPSDTRILDMLEEIVYHTLQCGKASEAYGIHRTRIGGFKNLGWKLGAFERGERICRAFAGDQAPETFEWREELFLPAVEKANEGRLKPPPNSPYMSLSKIQQPIFINEWGLYLMYLGRLAAAATCYEIHNKLQVRRERWTSASIGYRNQCWVGLLSGRLKGKSDRDALTTVTEALRLAKLSEEEEDHLIANAYHAHTHGLLGNSTVALPGFFETLQMQNKVDGDQRTLYGNKGYWHTQLLARLGRREQASQLTKENWEILKQIGGDYQIPNCQLILSELNLETSKVLEAKSLCVSAQTWAETRDAKEALCWSALVQARIELAAAVHAPSTPQGQSHLHLEAAEAALAEGLKIARDCGYGLYHIDLLLERARLHLLRGEPDAALADIALALEEGIPADETTGQPELLPANHEQCGYAWAFPTGLQRRAEALLLQAAQTLGKDSFIPAKIRQLPRKVVSAIERAKKSLHQALELWQPLHDPEPESPDQNFQLDGKAYNFRAAQTHQILLDLNGGLLTACPLEPLKKTPKKTVAIRDSKPLQTEKRSDSMEMPRPVFISYAHKDNENPNPDYRWLDRLREQLEPLVQQDAITLCSDQDIDLGEDWHHHIQTHLNGARAAVLLVSPAFLASKYIRNNELPILLKNARDKGVRIIPVILRPCLFEETQFKYPDPKTGPESFALSSLQAAGSPKKALSEMSQGEQDRALLKVAQTLARLVDA